MFTALIRKHKQEVYSENPKVWLLVLTGLSREEPVLEQSALVLEPEERQGGPEAGDLLFITA